MGNIHADIKPNGLNQRELVNAFCMIARAIQGICQKLDDDSGVTLTTYEANVVTALINFSIMDSQGNRFSNGADASSTLEDHVIVEPTGISDDAALAMMYQITNAFETLCEQLDDDSLTLSTYEANCYTAKFLHIVENKRGNALGNGTAYYFRPGGPMNRDELVDWLYNVFDAIETLTEQLDSVAEATVNDTDYEATWFTAVCLMIIENSQGNTVGNSSSPLYGLST